MILSDRRGTEDDNIENIIAELDALMIEYQQALQQLIRDNEAHETRLIQ